MCLGDEDGEKENDKDGILVECYAVYIAARLIGEENTDGLKAFFGGDSP